MERKPVDPATRLLADVMHIWIDGYICKNPNSMAPDSVSGNVFEQIGKLLDGRGISVDYCGWEIDLSPVDLPDEEAAEVPQSEKSQTIIEELELARLRCGKDQYDTCQILDQVIADMKVPERTREVTAQDLLDYICDEEGPFTHKDLYSSMMRISEITAAATKEKKTE